ncbi:MAG: hypothetical protein JWN39_2115 [Ilumatobacteraceae bacterium]|nr:hypothetical protein [Ilumatobacteraceae bacterium]
MSRRSRLHGRSTVLVVLLLFALLLGAAETAAATDESTTGPTVSLDPAQVRPDEFVNITIRGFTATYVVISVCGNEARRGSSDCNMPGSEGLRIDNQGDGGLTTDRIPIAAPPADCPCVIRVSSRDTGEIAVAPLVIIGHPISPTVDPTGLGNPIDVAINATPKPRGLVETARSGLGGPTRYDVTVTVHNHSAVPLTKIKVYGSAGRQSDNNLAQLDLDDPGALAAGQTWHQTVSVVVPAPSFGTLDWTVTASGVGPTVTSTSTTKHRPMLLIVIVMLLAADIAFLLVRMLIRRHATKDAEQERDVTAASLDGNDPIDVDSRELVDLDA